jgi:hypothetical protein
MRDRKSRHHSGNHSHSSDIVKNSFATIISPDSDDFSKRLIGDPGGSRVSSFLIFVEMSQLSPLTLSTKNRSLVASKETRMSLFISP